MVTRPTARPNPKAVEAIVEGYYSQLMTAGSTARERAQTAYTVASATAAAIVAAGVLTGISKFPSWVQLLGWLALGAWLVTAAIFMWISRKAPLHTNPSGRAKEQTFLAFAIDEAVDDATKVEKELRRALTGASVALLLTALAIALALLTPAQPQTVPATLFLKEDSQGLAANLCPKAETSTNLFGALESDSLGDAFVVLHRDAGFCRNHSVVLRIPRGVITAVRSPT